jgi:hypothetical protein
MIDAISTYINGVTLDHVSLHDMDAYESQFWCFGVDGMKDRAGDSLVVCQTPVQPTNVR